MKSIGFAAIVIFNLRKLSLLNDESEDNQIIAFRFVQNNRNIDEISLTYLGIKLSVHKILKYPRLNDLSEIYLPVPTLTEKPPITGEGLRRARRFVM